MREPLDRPNRRPTIEIGGTTYEVVDISIQMGRRRLKPTRPLKSETAERIARGVAKMREASR